MKEYFSLQYKMTTRKFSAAGINPALGFVLSAVAFVLISELIYYKTEFASYLVLLAVMSVLLKMSEMTRNEFLLIVFGNDKARKIRIAENLIISFPFAILLVFHANYPESVSLILASVVFASFSFNTNFNFTIPTPFYKKPFEFTVGFRNTFYVFPVAYILTAVAIAVDNLNLGIFAMLLVFLVSLSYYFKPENEYYVWIYSTSAGKFLLEKLMTGTIFSVLLTLPVLVGLIAFYPSEADIILVFLLIGLLSLWTIILAKYSVYPGEINLPAGILITICIYFPPTLIAVLPFFYLKSVKNLKPLLR